MTAVIRHVIEAIGPASVAHADAARGHVASAGAAVLDRLAATLGGAQHTPRPRADRRTIVVVAGDHGCGDPGIAMGADHPTIIAARAIAAGTAALAQVARASRTPIVLVDAGALERVHMPDTAVQLGHGPSRDLMREPAMTEAQAIAGLEAGIALSVSLSENRVGDTLGAALSENRVGTLGVLALGAIGVGAEVASAALLGAMTGRAPTGLHDDAMAEAAGALGAQRTGATAIELLVAFGGPDTAVLAGLILGAASMNLPVILDDYATGAAALVAARLAPHVTGYCIAAHRGNFTHPAILEHLGLRPVFDVGLGHGEGTGAAMVLPLIDQVAALAANS